MNQAVADQAADKKFFSVDFWGPVGSGKTTVADYLFTYWTKHSSDRPSHHKITKAFLNQRNRRVHLKIPKRTRPIGSLKEEAITTAESSFFNSKEVPEEEADVIHSKEMSLVGWEDRKIVLHSFGGEQLNTVGGKGYDSERILRFYRQAKDRLLIAVFNPFCINEELAKRGFLGLMAYLQSKIDNLTLFEAFELAANWLFHESLYSTEDAETQSSDEPDSEEAEPEVKKTETIFETRTKLKAFIESKDLENVKVCYRFHSDERNAFFISNLPPNVDHIVGADGGALLRALESYASGVFLKHEDPVNALRPVVQELDYSIIVLTHCDMLAFIEPDCSYELDNLFYYLFDKKDCLASQRILTNHANVFFEESVTGDKILTGVIGEKFRDENKQFKTAHKLVRAVDNWVARRRAGLPIPAPGRSHYFFTPGKYVMTWLLFFALFGACTAIALMDLKPETTMLSYLGLIASAVIAYILSSLPQCPGQTADRAVEAKA